MSRLFGRGKEPVKLLTQAPAPFELYEKEEIENEEYSLARWILELGVLRREQETFNSPFEDIGENFEKLGSKEGEMQKLRKQRWAILRKLIRRPEYADVQKKFGARPLRYIWKNDKKKRTPLMLALGMMEATDEIDGKGRRKIKFLLPTMDGDKEIVESRDELKERFLFINALLSNVDVKSSVFVRDEENEFPDSTALDQVYSVVHLYLANAQVRRLYFALFTKLLNIHSRLRPVNGQQPKIGFPVCDWCFEKAAAYQCECKQAKYCGKECQQQDYELHDCLSST